MTQFYSGNRNFKGPQPLLWLWSIMLAFLLPLATTAADLKLEGENGTLTGVQVATEFPGYSGTGYVWGFDQGADNIAFDFTATAGEYDLSIIYNSPYGDKKTTLQVNGQSSEQQFTKTSGFSALTVGKLQLKEGQNTIKLISNWGYYAIDYILVTPVVSKPVVPVPLVDGRAEAEAGVLDGVEVSTSPAGFSGSGYVTSFDNSTDKVTINFINDKTGLYELHIGYTSPFGEKGYDLMVNSERGNGMFSNTGGTFSAVSAGKFLLNEGLNTVTISKGWGYYSIDYIQLTPSVAPLPVKPPKQLTDAKATQSTRALLSYLTDLYGTKTLSGQYDDLDYVYEKTGKHPAVAGYDLMEYSPSRIAYGANPTGLSEKYIAWAKKNEGNGILTLAWHWNAPTDLINQAPDKLWWSGFYTRATTFDLAAALADKNSDRYKLLIRDIDAIAVELKKFQDADIPVLWRPLHEAAGGWFWWGAKGAEPFKELWRIMYDRLTTHHQLHNLIWVYTTDTQMNWYPGDAYVDMVGMDIYTDPSANMSGDWAAMQRMFGGKKLVSLSESGTLPVPDKVRGYGTWWSWFAVWSGGFIKNQPLDLLRAVYNDEDVITRDELPNWRLYGRPSITLTAPGTNAEFLLCDLPMLTAQASDAEGAVVKVTFSANGTVVGTDANATDGWSFSWHDAAAGTYALVAEATDNEGNTQTSAPVTVTVQPDVQAPVITLTSPATVLWPVDQKQYAYSVADMVTSVTDNCGPVQVIRIKEVSSDEKPGASGSGASEQDIFISADGQSVQLRAARAGTGNGRVYTVVIEAFDQYGNTGLATYQVQVPFSQDRKAKADAVAYTVVGDYTSSTVAFTATGAAASQKIAGSDFEVYPNPVSGGQLHISFLADSDQDARISLVNLAAQQVFDVRQPLKAGLNEVELAVGQLPKGVYILTLHTANAQLVRKIVVTR